MPEWITALAVQIPLVAAVVYAFTTRKLRSAGEIEDVKAAEKAERDRLIAQHERELRDKEAATVAWKQLFERVDAERREDRQELSESVKTLGLALDLVKGRQS